MSKKTVIFQAVKDEVKPHLLPKLTDKVLELIHITLFEWLRPANDGFEKAFQENSEKAADLLKRFPEMKFWKNPSDEELREAINKPKNDIDGRAGWDYSVTDEAMFVNGIVKIYVKGHKAALPINSSYTLPQFPGFRISEEVKNDD